MDPRTPVIVGVGQAEQRSGDPADAVEPVALLERAARAAGDDARAAILDRVDTVAVVAIVSWPYPDPGAVLARRLGLGGLRRTMTSTVGGNSPQLLVNTVAPMIERGDADVVLLGGAECMHTRWTARREPKSWLSWPTTSDPPCPMANRLPSSLLAYTTPLASITGLLTHHSKPTGWSDTQVSVPSALRVQLLVFEF